jgi:hypothetical protein
MFTIYSRPKYGGFLPKQARITTCGYFKTMLE